MAGKTYPYEALTASQLADLDRKHTLAFMAVSPLEVHGPHLPLGTDVRVAVELQRRIIAWVLARWPTTDFLIFPPLYAGGDALPAPGSVEVDSRAVYYVLLATGRCLAGQGFGTLVVTDNHGGPRHQIAIEKAVRRLYREHRFSVINPFLRLYRRMVEHDPDLLAETGTGPGSCGDDLDAHAGTNETGLMLAVAPDYVSPEWQSLGHPGIAGEDGMGRLAGAVARPARRLGASRLARDLEHLQCTLGWRGVKPMPAYMGEPGRASAEMGERMLEAHAAQAMVMLEEVRANKPPFSQPVLWDLRFIERSR